ncbi:MAG: hypothetical protein K8S14_00990 [Actinomycetia bacterium]|nr:hypothetical protein [Actinomycetes bacterium]
MHNILRRRQRRTAYVLTLATIVACGGCVGFFEQPSNTKPVNFRVENGASSFVEVTITVSRATTDDSDDDSAAADSSTTRTGGSNATEEQSPGRELPEPNAGPVADSEPTAEPNEAETEEPAPQLEVVTIGLPDPQPPKNELPLLAKTGTETRKETVSDGTVRVSPQNYTSGAVACGDEIVITATIEGTQTITVTLEGAGTGTVGFDEGSVGLDSERLLINAQHFTCGDTLVLRVSDPDTGRLEVYEEGATIPAPAFGAGSSIDPEEDTLEFRVRNGTGRFVELKLSDEPIADTEAEVTGDGTTETEVDNGIKIRVAPGFLTSGLVTCGPQIVLIGTIVIPDIASDTSDTFNDVVLTGTGTGTINFDENSVGPQAYQRLLLEGIHYECGDTIQIYFTDDGDPASENPAPGAAEVSLVD